MGLSTGLELEELLDEDCMGFEVEELLDELDEFEEFDELLDDELEEFDELLELFVGSESAESVGLEFESLEELFVDSLSSELLSTEDEELSADELDELETFSDELKLLDEPFSGVSLFPAQAAKVAEISAHNITTVKNLFINSPLDCFFSIVIRFVKR